MTETQRLARGHDFRPPAGHGIPKLYATEKIRTEDKILHAHYFIGGCDWWVAEYDPDEDLIFGYACMNDPLNAEWGYTSLAELETIQVAPGFVVERDLYWEPKPAREADLPGWGVTR